MNRLPRVAAAVAVSIFLSGCETMGSVTRSASSPIESLSPLVKKAFGSAEAMVSPTGNKFRSLIEKKQYAEAERLYFKEKTYFDERLETYGVFLATLSTGLNEPFIAKFDQAVTHINSAAQKPIYEQSASLWDSLKDAVDSADRLKEQYDESRLLSDPKFRLPARDLLVEKTDALRRQWLSEDSVDKAFARFNHFSDRSFFASYPVSIPPTDTFRRNLTHLQSIWDRASVDDLARFGGVYRSSVAGDWKPVFDQAVASAKQRVRGDKPITLAMVPQLRQNARSDQSENRFLESERLTIAEVVPSRPDGEPEFRVVVATSFAAKITTVEQRDAVSTPLFHDQSLVILTRPRAATANRKIASRSDTQSSYLTGKEMIPNPQYEVARQKYLQAESEYRQQQLSNTINKPANVFIGVLQGLSAVGLASARNEAFSQFQSTPSMVEMPIYRNYSFPVAQIDVKKSATVDVFVIDRTVGEYFSFSETISDAKSFQIASGIHKEDKTFGSSSFGREDDIAAFESAPMEVSVETIIASALSSRGKAVAKDERTLLTALNTSATASTQVSQRGGRETVSLLRDLKDPRSDSVVVVKTGSGLGSGFFVAPHMVVTNYHVVAGVKTVEIVLRDGTESVGRVVRVDEGLDLALIKVPEAGTPVVLAASGFTTGATVEAIGHPKGLTFSLTRGVVSAVRKIPNPVPGGKEILVVQTDAPISPGNSGGPLYIGDKVIGVNTQKLSGKGVEGIGFAVHASEVARFLDSH